uniref:Uncharacterized protein n=1 Tax=Oryza nivara TaxID=4536 RepID=A0A0E0GHS1_ORYNI
MDVCKLVMNDGFGPAALPSGGALPERDVYDTDQYMLALIYHARMRRVAGAAGEEAAGRGGISQNAELVRILATVAAGILLGAASMLAFRPPATTSVWGMNTE